MNARNLTRDVLGSLEVQTHGTLQTECPKSSRPSQKQTQEEGEMHIIWEVKGQTHTVMPAASDKQRGCNYALSQQSSHIEPDAISKSRTHICWDPASSAQNYGSVWIRAQKSWDITCCERLDAWSDILMELMLADQMIRRHWTHRRTHTGIDCAPCWHAQ